MKSILDDLPIKERMALVTLYETDGYRVLKKAIQLLRTNAGINALEAADYGELKHLQGQAHGLKLLHLNLKDLHKKLSKD